MNDFKKIILNSWQSHFWTNLATTAVLTLSFCLVLGAVLCSRNLTQVLSVWGEQIQVTVYLKDNISNSNREAILTTIQNEAGFDSSTYINKQKAFSSFEKSLSGYGPKFMESVGSAGDNPFPASYIVKLKKNYSSPQNIENFSKKIEKAEGVEDVSYGQEWLKNYSTLLNVIRSLTLLIALIILVGCVFTVSNSVQASLLARREEIEILELVGATATKIRTPFIIEGAFQGFVATSISLLLLGVFYKILIHTLENIMGSGGLIDALTFLPAVMMIGFLIFGILIGAFGSYVCVARLNTGWSGAQHLRA
jgi:cell division transport system permease protein